jgi:hypothetical protein
MPAIRPAPRDTSFEIPSIADTGALDFYSNLAYDALFRSPVSSIYRWSESRMEQADVSHEGENNEKYGTKLSAVEATSKYGLDGELKFDEPVYESHAQLLHTRKQAELRREYELLSGAENHWARQGLGFGVSMVASLADPVNLASMFIPIVGEERAIAQGAKATRFFNRGLITAESLAKAVPNKYVRRAVKGGIEGLAGMTVVEPFTLLAAHDEQAHYGWEDSAMSILMGAGMGAGLHSIGGIIGDRFRAIRERLKKADPATNDAALLGAVHDIVRDEPVTSSAPIVANDPRLVRESVKAVEADSVPEVVVASAIKLDNGEIFSGPMHGIAEERMKQAGKPEGTNFDSGFLTNKGRYISREEAEKLSNMKEVQRGNQLQQLYREHGALLTKYPDEKTRPENIRSYMATLDKEMTILEEQKEPKVSSERPVAAAYRIKGKVYSAPLHVMVDLPKEAMGLTIGKEIEEGFTTNKGRFISREEAFKMGENQPYSQIDEGYEKPFGDKAMAENFDFGQEHSNVDGLDSLEVTDPRYRAYAPDAAKLEAKVKSAEDSQVKAGVAEVKAVKEKKTRKKKSKKELDSTPLVGQTASTEPVKTKPDPIVHLSDKEREEAIALLNEELGQLEATIEATPAPEATAKVKEKLKMEGFNDALIEDLVAGKVTPEEAVRAQLRTGKIEIPDPGTGSKKPKVIQLTPTIKAGTVMVKGESHAEALASATKKMIENGSLENQATAVAAMTGEKGFTDQNGKWYTRKQAATVFKKQGGDASKMIKPTEGLHSEDLRDAGMLKHLTEAPAAEPKQTHEQAVTEALKDTTDRVKKILEENRGLSDAEEKLMAQVDEEMAKSKTTEQAIEQATGCMRGKIQ